MKKKYSRIAEVRKRYGGCSSRTIDRNVQLGIIAPPEYLHGIRIWDDELLDEYDARRQSCPPPTPRSSGGRGQPRKSTVDSPSERQATELCPEDQGAAR
jgi:hypothetical protein